MANYLALSKLIFLHVSFYALTLAYPYKNSNGSTSIQTRAQGGNRRFNSNTFAVSPDTSKYVLPRQATSDNWYKVKNLGRLPIWVRLNVKYLFGYSMEFYSGFTVESGKSQILSCPGRGITYIEIEVYNEHDEGAFMFVAFKNKYPFEVEENPQTGFIIDQNNFLKALTSYVVGHIPIIGGVATAVTDFFWPPTAINYWEQVRENVEKYVNTKTTELTQSIFSGELRQFERRIKMFSRISKRGPNSRLSNSYMNIAEDLVGLEQKFFFTKDTNSDYRKLNYDFLPFYVTAVSLQISFYQYGLKNRDAIGLSEVDADILQIFGSDLLFFEYGAAYHINEVFKEQLRKQLDHISIGDNIYDAMATVRSYIARNALEYISFWKNAIEHPNSTTPPYVDVISYSNMYGRPTHDLIFLAASLDPIRILTPNIENGERAKLITVTVYNNSEGLTGIRTEYNDGTVFHMGDNSTDSNEIDFEGGILKKIIVNEIKEIRRIHFIFEGRDDVVVGDGEPSDPEQVFGIPGYHIVGILATNDCPLLKDRLANIAVSYMLDKHHL